MCSSPPATHPLLLFRQITARVHERSGPCSSGLLHLSLRPGLWFTTFPSNPSMRLTDPEMRIAVCLGAGVVPYLFDEHGAPVKCPSARRGFNTCNKGDMRTEWLHRIHCGFENKLGHDRMHNNNLAKRLQLCALILLHAEKSSKWYTFVVEASKKDRSQETGRPRVFHRQFQRHHFRRTHR